MGLLPLKSKRMVLSLPVRQPLQVMKARRNPRRVPAWRASRKKTGRALSVLETMVSLPLIGGMEAM